MSGVDLKLMHRIEKLYTGFAFVGSQMLRDLLAQEGSKVSQLHAVTLMKRLGVEAMYRKPNT